MPQINTKFSVGETAFYAIFSTATIYTVTVIDLALQNGTVFYKLVRTDTGQCLTRVPESSVQTFSEAKASLQKYLQDKLIEVQNLTA